MHTCILYKNVVATYVFVVHVHASVRVCVHACVRMSHITEPFHKFNLLGHVDIKKNFFLLKCKHCNKYNFYHKNSFLYHI